MLHRTQELPQSSAKPRFRLGCFLLRCAETVGPGILRLLFAWGLIRLFRITHGLSPFRFVGLKLIGASVGRSTAAESAICKKSPSVDCLIVGRSKTTTPSTRPRGLSLRSLIRKTSTGNC